MDSDIFRVNAGVGAVVAIIDYLLETQKKHTHTHTFLNNCTPFKEILGTQIILTLNVQSFEGVKELIESRNIYRRIRGNYHLSRKQPKIRENKLIPL